MHLKGMPAARFMRCKVAEQSWTGK